jgi:hypothetical protein
VIIPDDLFNTLIELIGSYHLSVGLLLVGTLIVLFFLSFFLSSINNKVSTDCFTTLLGHTCSLSVTSFLEFALTY